MRVLTRLTAHSHLPGSSEAQAQERRRRYLPTRPLPSRVLVGMLGRTVATVSEQTA